ncbi:competence protein ComEA helix-hairpin-helix repeat region [Anaerovirgula multivorans]|uniref:Competence protein ComEA helix-hairpin-helix repeat region n=1 Tax=Anaerovirgula multivorans TaxID=312168 RepID=A0A239CIB2_9FIRM|nr:helix-hairpin-helix domain-containing protein [Anaerovirgula multivorans]SNS19431.1 competence protein ComEA helix-hairpin-helix repeat region [Anaerovirgula multivorans]
MKKLLIIFILCTMLFFPSGSAYAQESCPISILTPTNETKNGFPVFLSDVDSQEFWNIYNNSFIKKSVELYQEAQKYSDFKDERVYLTFKENSGRYARSGFYLKEDGFYYDKTKSPYIELSTSDLSGYYSKLNSTTQIFPHEMGHVIHNITAVRDNEIHQNSTNMHYSNIITEYSTAFSEGFAEHFEVISRIFEENEELKQEIYQDLEKKKNNIPKLLQKGRRDFVLPLRLDYYRMSVLFWLQTHEDLKRHELGSNGDGKYKNSLIEFNNTQKTILYRNMGLGQNLQQKRNIQQSLSTEIVVSNFFINLVTTGDGDLIEIYSKIFNVFSKYLNKDNTPELIEFVKGYMIEYPDEKDRILDIYKESTGYAFSKEFAPEIWVVSEGKYISIIMDQFGGLNFPFYVFNINTCEKEDLITLKGISKKEAEEIISYRESIGWFNDIAEIEDIPEISKATIEILQYNNSQERIQTMENQLEEKIESGKLVISFSNIIFAYIQHLFFRLMVWFILFFMVYYYIIIKEKRPLLLTVIKKHIKFLFLVALGLISVILSSSLYIGDTTVNPISLLLIGVLIMQIIVSFIIRKDKIKTKDSFISTLIMTAIILYSLY